MITYHLLIDWKEPDPQKKYVYNILSLNYGRSVNEEKVTLDHALEIIKGELDQVQHPDRSFQITLTPWRKVKPD